MTIIEEWNSRHLWSVYGMCRQIEHHSAFRHGEAAKESHNLTLNWLSDTQSADGEHQITLRMEKAGRLSKNLVESENSTLLSVALPASVNLDGPKATSSPRSK